MTENNLENRVNRLETKFEVFMQVTIAVTVVGFVISVATK